jgi:hypothetical protein
VKSLGDASRVRSLHREPTANSINLGPVYAGGGRTASMTVAASFADPHAIETERGLRLQAEMIIRGTGGVSRRLPAETDACAYRKRRRPVGDS